MKSNTMIFAPGWTQSIDTGGISERQDLASYISDTFKAINGFRPHFGNMGEWPLDDLRREAQSLEDEVVASIQRDKADAHERMLEANRVAVIYRNVKKPLASTYKPFANIKEIL